MKRVMSIAIAGVAVFALSGCDGDGGSDGGLEDCNTKLEYVDSRPGSGDASSIHLENHSDYTIDRVYSGTNGTTPVSSRNIPTDPGEFFTANSSRCDDDETLKIIDDEGCVSAVDFYRACNETANFEVVNNF